MQKHLVTYTFILAFALILFMSRSCTPVTMDYPSFDAFMKSVSKDTRNKLDNFRDEYDKCTEKETFIFFSDPHIFPSANSDTTESERSFNSKFSEMKNIFHYLDISFTICGGDWITKDDYQEFAKRKLLFAKHYMDKWFEPYYPIMGNHDTNYMGVVSENDQTDGDLNKTFIVGSLFNEFGESFYTFSGERTTFYILDSGIDWRLTDDKKAQLHWLAGKLSTSSDEHIAIAFHSFYNGSDITSMSQTVLDICSAFNDKGIVTFDKVTYDFSSTSGKVHFILSGHNHKDSVDIEQGIPIIRIINFLNTGIPSYDLCLINYDLMRLNMVRIGDGGSRTIDL